MGTTQERAVSLISKPPSARSDRDIEMVLPWLQKRSQLLTKLDRDTLKDILRHCSYQRAVNDDVIIEQGETGDKFYVIMTGRASVHIVTKTEEDGPEETEATTTPSRAKAAKQEEERSARKDTDGVDNEAEDKGLDRTVYGKFIMHYEGGTSFGEIALLSRDAIRNATIISDMDTDLLVIDRALFNRSVKAKEEEAYRERREFTQHHQLFSSWPPKPRRLLEMSLAKEVHPFGSVIMRQGQPARGLIFILSGQARLCMEPGRHETQFASLLKPPPDPLTTANKKPAVRDRARVPRTRKTHAQIEVRRHQGYAAAERRLKGRTVDLCCLERNEVIGDTEMVLELETNLATVVSTATTEVFVLNAKNYDRLLAKKHPHSVRQLVSTVCQKLAARMQTAKASQLPILPRLHAKTEALECRLGGAVSSDGASKRYGQTDKGENCHESRHHGQGGTEKTLARMFLQGKVPLIKPYVPDSLYYREASSTKMKAFMNSPYAKLRTINMINTYTAIRRKAPRSIQQLKGNVKAERELLGLPDEDSEWMQQNEDYQEYDEYQTPSPRTPRRPASAAPGFQSPRIRSITTPRPRSAIDLRIVPCRDGGDIGRGTAFAGWATNSIGAGGGGQDDEEEDTLDHHTVSEIFQHMDSVQRDKNESRMRVICTNTARSELRSRLEQREPGWSDVVAGSSSINSSSIQNHGGSPYDELYEDSFYDWETSDGNLRDLEARIASFCASAASKHADAHRRPSSSKSVPCVTQMKRFEVEDPNGIPLPGGTVFVHQKPCRYTPTPTSTHHHHPAVAMATASSPHAHVRRFMLQRDAQSQAYY